MIYIDTEPYRQKKNYFGNMTTVEELYFKRILNRYNDSSNLAELKSFIEQHIPNGIDSKWDAKFVFKHLILLRPEELAKFAVEQEPSQYEAIKELKKVYTDYNVLSKSIVYNKSETNVNQFLVRELGITVCPYCNRNYINNRGDRLAAQMDHFYSKDKYPWLAVSLYNLIPSCGACNHIKGTADFKIHPFINQDVQENEVIFRYKQILSDEVKVIISTTDKRKGDIEAIKLEEAYSIHNLDVKNMLFREEKYSKKYREELRQLLQVSDDTDFCPYLTDDEIDRMIYGDVIFEEDLKNVSLGKFRKDIYRGIKKLRDY